ncbi:curved DNA-binding protein CbpA [Planomicrobium koreense]|uniref:Curved DNA-binding protein CbpA n=1 Tax=Planococcus koreensis TaxID=112331 RepID=A0A7W8CUI5_9BACL|nr:DnaJ domain-containing protein [Planococcus koreensis]MBB5181109.1 curved DNA-binding protein CbpA [Planococcus koreensis]
MDKFIDYYTLLNILPKANEELIKRAYRIQSKAIHPDQGGDERHFILLTEAYEVLSNPAKRKAYDQEYAYYQQTKEGTKERPKEEREKSNHQDAAYSQKDYPKFSFDFIRYGKVMIGALIVLSILAKAISAIDDNTEPEIPVNPVVFPVEASDQSSDRTPSTVVSEESLDNKEESEVEASEQSNDIPSDTEANEELLDEKQGAEAASAYVTTDSSSLYNRYLDRIYKLEEDFLSYGEVWESGSDAEITQASQIQLKAWDDLLNEIYQTLKMELTDEEFIALRDLQRSWVVKRDRVSDAAIVDFTGGSWEVPVYNDAQLEETRKRCYWLVMNYMN